MARTAITVQTPTTTFITPTYVSADSVNGNSVTLTGTGLLLHVKNANAATRTLTLTTTNTANGFAITPPTYIIPLTTGDKMIALNSNELGALAVSGVLQLDWTADTGVTLAVIAMR
jgi:hypothetical protein